MIAVEEIVSDNLVVVVGSVRESATAITVSEGPDAGHAGLQLIVNEDVAAVVRRNASLVEVQVARIRNASHCQENMSAQYFRRTFLAIDADGNMAVALRQ